MMHIGKAFQREKALGLYRTNRAVFADVVSQQIHDHQIFCTVFQTLLQLFSIQSILNRIIRAWPRPLDRSGFHMLTLHLNEALRGSGEDLHAGQIHVGGKRRRTDISQMLIGLPGIALHLCRKTLRQIDLITVSFMYIGFNPVKSRRVRGQIHVGVNRGCHYKIRFASGSR